MKSWIALAIALVSFATAAAAEPASDPSIRAASVGQEEMAVYEAVLASWLRREKGRQRVDQRLRPAPSGTDPKLADCTKGLHFPEKTADVGGRNSLAGAQFKRSRIDLVDGSHWNPADPGQAIARGKSVEGAVREGFASSLISFSQIAFSRDGNDALVEFSMVCGGLCGSGATIHLHRSGTEWAIVGRCESWIS